MFGSQQSSTIASGGTWMFFGDIVNLTIQTESQVSIIILGKLTNLTLPNTTKTVMVKAMLYDGAELISSNVGALMDGSKIGKYDVRSIAL